MSSYPFFVRVFSLLAIALLLPFGGCNSSQNAGETPTEISPSNLQSNKANTELSPALRPWQKPQLLHSLEADSTPIKSIAISPDSKTIASSSFSGKIQLWNLQSGNECSVSFT